MLVIVGAPRNHIAPRKPTLKINVGASPRAERPIGLVGRFAADGAG